jgi:hypothetical protein
MITPEKQLEIEQNIFNRLKKEVPMHMMSPETKQKFEEMGKCNKEQSQKIDQLLILAKNQQEISKDNQGKIKELTEKTEKVYTIYKDAGRLYKGTLKAGIYIGVISGAILGIIGLFREVLAKK